MKINYLEEKKTNDTANFATDTGATAKTTSPKPKYRFVMGEKKRKAEASGQKFTDTWTPLKQTEDYYTEPVSLETFNALNPDGGNSNSLYSFKKAQREGARIRNSLKNALSQTNTGNYSANVFDDIDDDTIEKNIPLADESLKLNQNGILTKDISKKYPYYRDGMAMMYAADEKGNKTAAKAAKFAAYTLENENLPESATKAESKVKVKNESKVEANNEPEAQNGNSLVMPTGIRLLGNNVNAAVIEKLEANKYNDGNISTFSESVSKTEPKGKSFYEDYKSRSQSNKPSLFNVFGKRFDLNINEQMKPHKKFNLYYGDIWMGQPQTDLDVNDFSKDDLIGFYSKSDKYKRHQKALMNLHPIVDSAISEKDMQLSAEEHIKRFRDLARMSSTGQMKFVLEDMIDHFIDGNGADFSHEDLTKEVANHKVTKEFMSDFTNVLETQLQLYNGDISAIIENGGLSRALKDAGVYLSQYDYSGTRNVVGGLTLAIHSWTESNVEIENYSIDKKGNYKGTLKFTFKDNFGLDIDDLPPDYAAISGFRSWFILQHYDKYEGKYKPFKTVVEIEYPISGKIEVKK